MHIGPKENDDCTHNSGIQRNDDAGLDSDDENVNFLCEEVDNDDTVQLQENDIDILTFQAVDIIESSGWLNGTASNKQNQSLDNHLCYTSAQQLQWKMDIKSQS